MEDIEDMEQRHIVEVVEDDESVTIKFEKHKEETAQEVVAEERCVDAPFLRRHYTGRPAFPSLAHAPGCLEKQPAVKKMGTANVAPPLPPRHVAALFLLECCLHGVEARGAAKALVGLPLLPLVSGGLGTLKARLSVDPEKMATLVGMGFTDAQARRGLAAAKEDVDRAVDWLFGKGTPHPTFAHLPACHRPIWNKRKVDGKDWEENEK